jgi:hypothetical protein
MPLPVIADVIRVAAEFNMSNGHVAACIHHIRKSGALSYAAAIAIADPIIAAFWTNHTVGSPGFCYYLHNGASFQRLRYTPLDGSSATTIINHVQAGAAAADALPENVALAVTLYTALRGRRNRGRMYLGGFTEGNSSGASPNAGMLTDLTNQFNAAYITGLVGSGVSLVVASYIPPGAANNVTAVNIDSRWDTQRRRLRP